MNKITLVMKNIFQILVDISILISDIEGIEDCLNKKINFIYVNVEKNNALRKIIRYGLC